MTNLGNKNSELKHPASGWKKCLDLSSKEYYYWNSLTGDVTWQPPPDLCELVEIRHGSNSDKNDHFSVSDGIIELFEAYSEGMETIIKDKEVTVSTKQALSDLDPTSLIQTPATSFPQKQSPFMEVESILPNRQIKITRPSEKDPFSTYVEKDLPTEAPTKKAKSKAKSVSVGRPTKLKKTATTLFEKWKLADAELHEDEQPEVEEDPEALEQARLWKIEDWRVRQIQSGEADNNPNFIPIKPSGGLTKFFP
eukprot:TRINITY_DN5618_c0_g1_i1.p1 TRINITY_DN5618_c0_g1~~TRINITY_DN5618_c0_g1_i1.p1  ORF type:complete len:252 (-),score=54.71 TRINITY_DN5618_c0_g1_i1:106-861(-)